MGSYSCIPGPRNNYVWGDANGDHVMPMHIGWDRFLTHGDSPDNQGAVAAFEVRGDVYNARGISDGWQGSDDMRWDPSEALHPICIAQKAGSCDVGDVSAEACWDSGPTEGFDGRGFVLYYMAADTFPRDASAARKYQQICEAAGLHTFLSLIHI